MISRVQCCCVINVLLGGFGCCVYDVCKQCIYCGVLTIVCCGYLVTDVSSKAPAANCLISEPNDICDPIRPSRISLPINRTLICLSGWTLAELKATAA